MNGVYATYRHPYCFGCRWLGFCESMCCSRQRCCTGCWFISWCLPHSHSVSLGHVVCLSPRTGSLLFCNYCHFKDFTSQCLGKMGNEKASLWEIGLLEVNIFFSFSNKCFFSTGSVFKDSHVSWLWYSVDPSVIFSCRFWRILLHGSKENVQTLMRIIQTK